MPDISVHNAYKMVDGHFVSAKAAQIVQAIRDYSPEIVVKWIPPGNRSSGESAYAIIHNPPGGMDYVMFYVKHDEDFDERVLQKIIFNDQRNGKAQLSEFEAWEASHRLTERQKLLDEMEEASDIAYHVFKSHKNTYKVNPNLIIKEGIPFNAKGM